jgi:MFS family permease
VPRQAEVGLIYVIGLVQGLALVTFPAASSIFTSPHGFGFSASRYGMMFIPQVILAILASSLGPRLARRWTLKRVLLAGLSADFLAMTLLALSRLLQEFPGAAYITLLVATGALGFGFGATVMAANTYAEKFSPGRENRAVPHAQRFAGAGTAIAPLFVAIVIALRAWWLLQLVVAVAWRCCFSLAQRSRSKRRSAWRRTRQVQSASRGGSGCIPPPFCSTELLKP